MFTSSLFDPHYSRLEINNLSGHLHFRFHKSFVEQCGDYLLIKKGMGQHKISVIDSGIKITNSPLLNQDLFFQLDLIHDQSGKAHFTLADFLVKRLLLLIMQLHIHSK
nr:pertactin-like passenger domain-containing protein [Bartonella florencae]